jgi:hypothetical protein
MVTIKRKQRVLLSEGWNAARICRVVGVGTQEDYNGDLQEQMVASFVFSEEDDYGPIIRAKTVNVFLSPKSTLTRLASAAIPGWRFDDEAKVDPHELLGRTLYIEVQHERKQDGTITDKLVTFATLPKGVEAPEQIKEPLYFWLDKDGFSKKALDRSSGLLPEWTIEKILESPEYAEFTAAPKATPKATPAVKSVKATDGNGSSSSPTKATNGQGKAKKVKAKAEESRPTICEELNDEIPI